MPQAHASRIFCSIGYSVENPYPPHQLNGLPRHIARYFVGITFGDRAFADRRQTRRGARDRPIQEETRRIAFHLHFGQVELHRLKIDDGFSKLVAFLHVFQNVIEGGLGNRKAHSDITTALQVEGLHQLLETTGRNDLVACRNAYIVEIYVGALYAAQTHMKFQLSETNTRPVLFNQNCTDSMRSRHIRHTATQHKHRNVRRRSTTACCR